MAQQAEWRALPTIGRIAAKAQPAPLSSVLQVAVSRGAVLTPLSQSFDLAEGRAPGHAARVAYVAVTVGMALGADETEIEEAFFAALLHDAGMAANAGPHPTSGLSGILGTGAMAAPARGWRSAAQVVDDHCLAGGRIAEEMGFGPAVVLAVRHHHDCWDVGTPQTRSRRVTAMVNAAERFESLTVSGQSPLLLRFRAPAILRDMASREIDPEIARAMALLVGHDEFWLGLQDTGLVERLGGMDFGAPLDDEEILALLGVIADAADERSGNPAGFSRWVARTARRAADACGVPSEHSGLIEAAALMRDIGATGVAAESLRESDLVNVDEMARVRRHPGFARTVASTIPGLSAVAEWVGAHHERWDGKGYPGMLAEGAIPLEAQIIAMAETYVSLMHGGPGRCPLASDAALKVLASLSGERFDPSVVSQFGQAFQDEREPATKLRGARLSAADGRDDSDLRGGRQMVMERHGNHLTIDSDGQLRP